MHQSQPNVEKSAKTKEEIQRLIVAELQTFNPGNSDGEACYHALQHIVPLFQRAYALVQKH